jgi:hypothetical protein
LVPDPWDKSLRYIRNLDQLLAVFKFLATLKGDPYSIIAVCNNGVDIGLKSWVGYILTIRSTKALVLAAIKIIEKVDTPERRRLCQALGSRLGEVEDEDDVILSYVGKTNELEARVQHDLIDLVRPVEAEENNLPDYRTPLSILQNVAGGAVSRDDFGAVTFQDGTAFINGAEHVISKGLPPILRIPYVRYDLLPEHVEETMEASAIAILGGIQINMALGGSPHHAIEPELLSLIEGHITPGAHAQGPWLTDATGKCKRSFDKSRTGRTFVRIIQDLERGKTLNMHQFIDSHRRPESPSNEPTVTTDNIFWIIDCISDDDIVIGVVGLTVALYNTSEHLVMGSVLLSNALFTMQMVEILGIERILVIFPHPGVMNYFGDNVKWVLEAFSHGIALHLLLCSRLQKHRSIGRNVTARQLRDEILACPIFCRVHEIAKEAACNSFWNGNIVTRFIPLLRAGFTMEQAFIMIRREKGLCTVLTFKLPDVLPSEGGCRIQSKKSGNPRSSAKLSIWVKEADYPFLFGLEMDSRFRGEEDQWGFPFLDKFSRLRFKLLNGQLLVSSQGELFDYSKTQWLSMVRLGAHRNVVEIVCKNDALWEELMEIETWEVKGKKGVPGSGMWRLVLTLDRTELIKGVTTGKNWAFKSSNRITLRFLDRTNPDQPFPVLDREDGTPEWNIKPVHDRCQLRSTHTLLAPFFEKDHWGFEIFEKSAATGWEVVHVGTDEKKWHRHGDLWPQRHGQATALFKVGSTFSFPTPSHQNIGAR